MFEGEASGAAERGQVFSGRRDHAGNCADGCMRGFEDLPIVSPHGHTQAGWFARNEPFPDPVTLFVQPDHYVFRMLYSQGISLEDLEIGKQTVAGSAQGVAHFCEQLFPVSRNAVAVVAGLCVSEVVRA